jgi:hypothetical protein
MIKSALKNLLPLCLLLLSGFSVIYAGSSRDLVSCSSSIKLQIETGLSHFFSAPHQEGLSVRSVTHDSKKFDRIYIEENKEETEEITFFKKYIEIGNYFAVFYPRTNKTFCSNLKSNMLFSEHFSYYSSMRYIILRVIRI